MHQPSLPLLHRTERRMVRRGPQLIQSSPPSSGSLRPLTNLSAGRQDRTPPPLLNLSTMDCESCCESTETGRRKPTPDLLELSSRYETLHRQSLARTQSGEDWHSRRLLSLLEILMKTLHISNYILAASWFFSCFSSHFLVHFLAILLFFIQLLFLRPSFSFLA